MEIVPAFPLRTCYYLYIGNNALLTEARPRMFIQDPDKSNQGLILINGNPILYTDYSNMDFSDLTTEELMAYKKYLESDERGEF
jgi:hypothetical protein